MNAENPTLLVAGAGDLGLRVARLALLNDWNVIAIRRTPPDDDRSGIEWIQADLGQGTDLRLSHRSISHALYALAPDERSPQAYEHVFLTGLRHLVSELKTDSLQRFIFVSSTAVYGPSEDILDENSPTDPSTFNGKILVQAEQELHTLLPTQAISLRLSGLYGPKRTHLLERLRQGKVRAPDSPSHYGNRIHIEDAARAAWHLLNIDAPFPCYIGTDGHSYPLSELYDGLASLLGLPPPPRQAYAESGKRLSNQRLVNSGFQFTWPDALQAYAELIKSGA